ncbi:PaaX family transcriptional regulator C-terminal domain-containing protein [Frankia tisae]|uniref:PaaX family transcriptional regulator C-terminal domain-containing protein n=1 Tax=Frankia tisae TaxID=2950104 RepID=UPI0021BE7096|nr:PaaX family transcriptional regulator C-terminal domain-containing protein [Frankia tisae]
MTAGEFPGVSAQSWVPLLIGTALPARPFASGAGLVDLLATAGYAAGATRVGLSRLCADGSLERRRDGRQTSYRLGRQMAETVTSVGGRVESFGRSVGWDGSWTIVLASVPDELRSTRRRMKSALAYLGFGRLREATWVAARACEDEVKDLVESLDLAGLVDVFVGRPSALADVDAILHRCWDLGSLTQRYSAFVARFAPLRAAVSRDALTGPDALLWWMRLTHDYRELVYRDPELPPEFLPPEARALREQVVDTYATAHGGLDGRATAQVRHALGIG